MHRGMSAVKLAVVALAGIAPARVGAAGEAADVKVIFFYVPGCRMCAEAAEAVKSAEEKYAGRIEFERVDLSASGDVVRRYFDMLDRHGVAETPEMAVFVGAACLAGAEAIVARLDAELARALGNGSASLPRPKAIDRLGIMAVSAAALADGVNPCAFATMVLLVSMMATAGRSRREAAVIGAAFALAVYATYFIIGLALYGVLRRLKGLAVFADLVYMAAFFACLVFGALSTWDAVLAARGREAREMLLKVPEALRRRMHAAMSRGIRSASLVGGAAMAGVIVSFLESACTGQVYFPVIAGLVRTEGKAAEGLGLLAWYNLVFITPLVAILGLALAGVGSGRLARFGRSHWGVAKLLLAFAFAGMALWMWRGIVWPPGARP